ncbi:MAG: peptidylprolyl isomerase [Blastocatellia bacterium]|nr:peptidylprolyl isomerase [Blastocatellia bacterium]
MTTDLPPQLMELLCLRVLEGPALGDVFPFDQPFKKVGDPQSPAEFRLELNDTAAEANLVTFHRRDVRPEPPHISIEVERRSTDLWHNGFLLLGQTCNLYPADMFRIGDSTLRVERFTPAARRPAYRLFPWESLLSFQHPEADRILSSALTYAAWLDGARFLDKAIEGYVVVREATSRGLEVDDDALQEAADTFRTERGLLKAAAFHSWLKQHRLTLDGWEQMMVEDLLRARLSSVVISEDRISEYFALNRRNFDEIELAMCLVREVGMADEIAAQSRESVEAFYALSRIYSVDPATAPQGGYRGWVRRTEVPVWAADILFSMSPRSLHGPVFENGVWALYLVHDIKRASLDPAVHKKIGELLFAEWLRPLVAQESFKLTVAG